MPDAPTTAATQAAALAMPASSAAGLLFGVPDDLIFWALTGAMLGEAKVDPPARPADAVPPSRALSIATTVMHLALAALFGGALAETGADIIVIAGGKIGFALNDDAILQRAAAIGLGFGSRFIAEGVRWARRRYLPEPTP